MKLPATRRPNCDESASRRIDERELVDLLVQGDLVAFDHLVERYGNSLMAFLDHLLADRSQSEDVVHDTLLKVFEDRDSHRRIRALTPWVFRIARNLALDRIRTQKRREQILESLAPRPESTLDSPSGDMERREFTEAVMRALASLPEVFRTAFVLREVEGLSYDDIALVLGCNTKTVSSRLSRARRDLRQELGGWVEDRS